MLRSSALYIVIIISLIIALICSSLIVAAYYYRLQTQKFLRYDRLLTNLNSGINILLSDQNVNLQTSEFLNLSNNDDSVYLQKKSWGVFDVGIAKAFIQNDTLKKIFFMANELDSAKWAVLYIPDKKNNLAFSGKTFVKGNVYIPKGGVVAASVDGYAYSGDKKFITGKIYNSSSSLPALDGTRISFLEGLFDSRQNTTINLSRVDSLFNSFSSPTLIFDLKKNKALLQDIKLSGNIIIHSDTTLEVDSTAKLNEIIIVAKSVEIKNGFNGNCQIFAQDGVSLEENCTFNYPSCVGLLRLTPPLVTSSQQVKIDDNVQFNGQIFTYEGHPSNFDPLISIGKNVKVTGQVYLPGGVSIASGSVVNGSVFANYFIYQSSAIKYTNNFVNVTLNGQGISPYYLNSNLVPVTKPVKKVLKWLKGN